MVHSSLSLPVIGGKIPQEAFELPCGDGLLCPASPFGIRSEIADRLGASEQSSLDVDRTVFLAVHVPGNEHDLAVHQLKAGNAPGVNAAARIEIGSLSGRREFRPVGMAADNHDIPLLVPFIVALFYLVPLAAVFGRAGGILYADDVEKFPDVPDQKIGYSPKLIVDQVSLMAVNDEDFLSRIPVL